jgi:DNA gyrase subunit A
MGTQAAAMRYTEARLSKIAMEMLRDINKNTVDFGDNYDGSEKEPLVLPSRFPNLLVNGSTGIAVGMATNIPPHNLSEVIDAIFALIDNPDLTVIELMEYIKGPDFPTGATILGNSGIKKAYETGKGIIKIRANCEIVKDNNGRESIIVTEIPYQVNKANLVEKIANLVKEEKITGISDLRDESNMYGIRIVIEIKKDANANIVLNNLYNAGILQVSYGINMLALVNSEPKLLSLKEMLGHYIDFQKEVITRRTQFDLEKAETRAHILEGLIIALENIDEVVVLIKKSKNDEEAKKGLIEKFKLSSEQATAILEMKLRRLTGLERGKIEQELLETRNLIQDLKELLKDDKKILSLIKEELLEIKEKYKDIRRTKIDLTSIDYIENEDLIPKEDIIITMTNKGYIKRTSFDIYKIQNKGGVGIRGISLNEEDGVEHFLHLSTHDHILFFSNKGKVYRLKGYEVPEYGRQAKGIPIINLLHIEKDELINSVLSLNKEIEKEYLLFATKKGYVKRILISELNNVRKTGKIVVSLDKNDELIGVRKTSGKEDVMLASSHGRMIRFSENDVRIMGRKARGVKGIDLDNNSCIGVEIVNLNKDVLVITENGYGKRTKVNEYRQINRGGKGVKTIKTTKKNGKIISFKIVEENEDLMLITNNGILIKIPVEQVSLMKRITQGVKLINLKEKQTVVAAFNIKGGRE